MDFNNKVVLITGASSGFGEATAIYLSKLSATVVLVGRNENNLNKVALDCEQAKGIKPLTFVAELSNDGDLERIVKETIATFGKINVLVNNAGILALEGLKETKMETYDRIMAVNLRAVYYLTQFCAPHLINSKGSIVNVSSSLSTTPNTSILPYSLSKAALDHFTRCIALELGPDGVRVNSVNPGYVETNILKNVGWNEDQLKTYTNEIVSKTPLGKMAKSDEVAALIAFYASDTAKSITGTCTIIDGGNWLT